MKYYCILAIKKDNPKKILGYIENSFSMSWSKDRVCLYCGDDYKGVPKKESWKEKLKHGSRYGSLPVAYKGKMQYMKNLFLKNSMHACGRTVNEFEWNCVKTQVRKLNKKSFIIKLGYEIKAFRVNSKFCPVFVDLTERNGMMTKKLEYNKFNFRNASFKAL